MIKYLIFAFTKMPDGGLSDLVSMGKDFKWLKAEVEKYLETYDCVQILNIKTRIVHEKSKHEPWWHYRL